MSLNWVRITGTGVRYRHTHSTVVNIYERLRRTPTADAVASVAALFSFVWTNSLHMSLSA